MVKQHSSTFIVGKQINEFKTHVYDTAIFNTFYIFIAMQLP